MFNGQNQGTRLRCSWSCTTLPPPHWVLFFPSTQASAACPSLGLPSCPGDVHLHASIFLQENCPLVKPKSCSLAGGCLHWGWMAEPALIRSCSENPAGCSWGISEMAASMDVELHNYLKANYWISYCVSVSNSCVVFCFRVTLIFMNATGPLFVNRQLDIRIVSQIFRPYLL